METRHYITLQGPTSGTVQMYVTPEAFDRVRGMARHAARVEMPLHLFIDALMDGTSVPPDPGPAVFPPNSRFDEELVAEAKAHLRCGRLPDD